MLSISQVYYSFVTAAAIVPRNQQMSPFGMRKVI